MILNEGDSLDKQVLCELMNLFKVNKFTKIIYTNSILTNKKDKFLTYYPADDIGKFFEINSYLKPVINSSVFFRNSIFKELGFFDINLKYHFIFEYLSR